MFGLNISLVFGLCWILAACLATTFKPYRKISGYRCAPSFPYTGPRPAPSDRHCMLWRMSHGCTVMQAPPECHCCGTVETNSTTSILAPIRLPASSRSNAVLRQQLRRPQFLK
ncbi:unnamed protein product [Cyprideis torosa]|uniref:Uncharacterized protein n=1 Tax=Cyprideis torosa TaxID=163714 RepID=A0A7R8WKK2_9CRUS|nr:unnamed protein product [Cyprideis torosa]CAG0903237.1 unnamed protein product [Cyprideis torosa]